MPRKKGKVKYDERDKPLENITINVDTAGEDVKITTDIRKNNGLFRHDKGGEVNFVIYLPAGMSLDIDNTNGELRISDVSGDIKIDHVNGSIGFLKCTGYVSVKSVNSEITGNFDSTKGVDIDMANGNIKLGGLKNISARFDVETDHGKVTYDGLTMTQQTSNRLSLHGIQGVGKCEIKIRTIHGKISLSGTEVRIKEKGDKDKWNFKFDFDDTDFDFDGREQQKRPSETKSNADQVDSVKSRQPVKTNDSAKVK